jgi:hypothetical protein
MADVQIVCPTHGRAGEVLAFRTFGPDLLLSVAESQVPAYRAAYPDARIDPHSDEIKGLPAKKQMLAEKFGDVFWVDDDAIEMIDHTLDCAKVEPRKACALVHRLADQCEQMGLFMFGFSLETKPLYYSGHQPFALTGMIGGGKFGILAGSKMFYPDDPALGMWEDLWMSGLNAFHHRALIRDERYAIPTAVGQSGGLANVRTHRSLWQQVEKMQAAFGKQAIVLKDASDVQLYPWRLKIPW